MKQTGILKNLSAFDPVKARKCTLATSRWLAKWFG